jgi:hypothetical protein
MSYHITDDTTYEKQNFYGINEEKIVLHRQ